MGLTKSNFYKKRYEIVCSLDDGGKDDLRVAGLLKKYCLPGIFYIVLDWVGLEGYLNWNQIKELVKMGFTIGSHSVSHPQDLKKLYDEGLHYEIQNSKDMLETALGIPVKSFCYPRGRFNERVKRFVSGAGYTSARATGNPGIIEARDRFALPGTIHVFQRREYGDKSILEFAKEMIDRVVREGGYCNIWGHSREINDCQNWEVLEEILKYIKKQEK